jgi:hypothetical protein
MNPIPFAFKEFLVFYEVEFRLNVPFLASICMKPSLKMVLLVACGRSVITMSKFERIRNPQHYKGLSVLLT